MWDSNIPGGQDNIKFGAEQLRDFKVDLEDALNEEHLFPIDGSSPQCIHKIPYGKTINKPSSIKSQQIYINNETHQIEFDHPVDGWQQVGSVIPTGAKMFFIQNTAPVGWTRYNNFANDVMLKLATTDEYNTGEVPFMNWEDDFDGEVPDVGSSDDNYNYTRGGDYISKSGGYLIFEVHGGTTNTIRAAYNQSLDFSSARWSLSSEMVLKQFGISSDIAVGFSNEDNIGGLAYYGVLSVHIDNSGASPGIYLKYRATTSDTVTSVKIYDGGIYAVGSTEVSIKIEIMHQSNKTYYRVTKDGVIIADDNLTTLTYTNLYAIIGGRWGSPLTASNPYLKVYIDNLLLTCDEYATIGGAWQIPDIVVDNHTQSHKHGFRTLIGNPEWNARIKHTPRDSPPFVTNHKHRSEGKPDGFVYFETGETSITHTHTKTMAITTWRPLYVNCILCRKD